MENNFKRTVGIYTLGCKVNQYESEAMAEALAKESVEILPPNEKCDAYIINTCTVTAESDRKARQFIRRAISNNPNAFIAVTGCSAQINPEELSKISGVDFICGNSNKLSAVTEILDFFNSGEKNQSAKISVEDINKASFENMSIEKFSRTRAYVKIEDGCENKCAYCIIPFARGNIRSKAPDILIGEVQTLVANGCKEIVLTGIETASYGKDLDGVSLTDVLCKIDKLDGLKRIRLGSLDPSLITPSFVEKISSLSSLAPHFHLSLQSGSSRILALMKRKYNAQRAMQAIELLKEKLPSVNFTTDVIVGFPQETREDLEQTAEFIKKAEFLTVHLFPYSDRQGTVASQMKGKLDASEKSRRLHLLEEVANETKAKLLERRLREAPIKDVLFETFDGKTAHGHTDNFIEVSVETNSDVRGIILPVRLVNTDGNICFGTLISERKE